MQLAHPITVVLEYPAIPTRAFDYSAADDNYEPGNPVSHGATPLGAVERLLEHFDLEPRPVTFIEQRGRQFVVHHLTADSVFPQDVFASESEAKARVMRLVS